MLSSRKNNTIKNTLLHVVRKIKKMKRSEYVDERRFWTGKTLPSPKAQVPLFGVAGVDAQVLTFEKESRDCISIKPKAVFSFELTSEDTASRLKLSFATQGEPQTNESIKVFKNEEVVVELSYVVPDRWHSVRIQNPQGKITIENKSNSEIFLAHPIIEHLYAKEKKKPKNVIMILLDSVWRDSLGAYNQDQIACTPNITRFFQSGIRYANAFTQSEWTLPSVYSTLTARYSIDHGMTDLKVPFASLSGEEQSLPKTLKAMGYSTLAYSTVKVFHPAFNGHSGFDRFIYDPFPQPEQTHRDIAHKAVEQLMENQSGQNFLLLHFLDTHEPWTHPTALEESMLSNFRITDPSKEYEHFKKGYGDTKAEPRFSTGDSQLLSTRRNARLVSVDASLQVLFDYLERTGEAENTIVALYADHGYQYLAEKRTLLTHTRTNVPLLIKNPVFKATVVEDLVALNLDLGPTLVAMCDGDFKGKDGFVAPPCGVKGRKYVISESIFGNLYKVAVRDHDFVYHLSCVYDFKEKKIHTTEVHSEKLFAIKDENAEKDISSEQSEAFKIMKNQLRTHLERFPEKIAG